MRLLLLLSISLLTTGLSFAHDPNAIAPKDAYLHAGKTVTVHGFVGEVTSGTNGDLVIRFGRPDPNHPFEAVVPQKSIATVGNIVQALAGMKAAIRGSVTMDGNKALIVVTNPSQILNRISVPVSQASPRNVD